MRNEIMPKKEKEEQGRKLIEKELTSRGYSNISLIGKGGFSEVFRVWDDKRKGFLACKINVKCEMGKREAQMLRSLKHPLFPRYVESFEGVGRHFLLMEYVCGSNLRELLERRVRFTQRQAVSIAMELAQGLLWLHECSEPILFRDIKPDNVMLRQDGRVKLIDVGCMGKLKEGSVISGSKGYSAPEQFDIAARPGVESDVYALGKLLHYMLTGDDAGRLNRRQGVERVYYKGVSRGLIQLVEQAVQKQQSMRVPDMRIFLQRLAIYRGKSTFKSLCTDVKACLFGGEIVYYYYIQNVHKGIDNHGKMC